MTSQRPTDYGSFAETRSYSVNTCPACNTPYPEGICELDPGQFARVTCHNCGQKFGITGAADTSSQEDTPPSPDVKLATCPDCGRVFTIEEND